MKNKATQVANYLKGLASPQRLMILCTLADGEKSVTDLVEVTGFAQSSVSQHLSKLKEEGIVTFKRDHRTLYYRLSSPLTQNIMALLYKEFCQHKTGE